jgi:leucyl-tRNA synthetase
VGGVEHAILHLLYSRFFTKVLRDMGLVNFDEPFARLFTQGIIEHLAYRCPKHNWIHPNEVQEGNRCPHCGQELKVELAKMSKSKRNTISPQEVIDQYGADTERLYTLFMGPPEKDIEWTDEGVRGSFRFLNRVWNLVLSQARKLADAGEPNPTQFTAREKKVWQKLHQTIKSVTEDIEGFHFNTAVSAIMELTKAMRMRSWSSAGRRMTRKRCTRPSVRSSSRSTGRCGIVWSSPLRLVRTVRSWSDALSPRYSRA